MQIYLEPICDILAYNLNNHEFQILLRLKNRESFKKYYQTKKKKIVGQEIIPKSTYIFSQSMSNLQNSSVKKFNIKYGRSGTMMAGRFKRELITSREGVIKVVQELNNGNQKMRYSGIWADCAMKRIRPMTSIEQYKSLELNDKSESESKWNDFKMNLVGILKTPQINDKYFKFKYLNRRAFNSICRYFE
jgi:hypothetical protein